MQKIANAPLGSFKVKDILTGVTDDPDHLQEVTMFPCMTFRLDEVGPTYYYYGYAKPGTATSAASWRIIRFATGTSGSVMFPNGNDAFTFIWDNRASLSYS